MGDSSQTQTTQQQGTSNATQNATTSSSRNPWAAATPNLQSILGQSSTLFNQSNNPALAGAITQGQNQAISNATGGATTGLANQGMGAVSGLFSGGGLSDQQRSALSGIGSSLGSFNTGNAATTADLTPIANGSQIGANNPAFQQALQASLDKARDTIGSQFAGAGRYGSASMGDAEATSLGNIAANATQNQYNTDRASQLAAIGQLSGVNQSGLSGNLQGQSATSGIGQQGIANQLAGVGTIGTLGQDQNFDANTLTNTGNQGWQNLDNYGSLSSTIAGLGGSSSGSSSGTSTGTTNSDGTATTQNNPSLFGSLTAGLGGGLNLLKGLGSIGIF